MSVSENPHHQSSSSSESRLRRSVRFNLDLNTICEKKGAEYSSNADAHWYTNEQVRFMRNSTLRNAVAYRQLVATLRKIQGRANQYAFLSGVLGENDVICIHGIENLVSSVSVRRNLVSTEQRRMNVHVFKFLRCVKLISRLFDLSALLPLNLCRFGLDSK